MIFNMADGWSDHCTEGPCDLYCKSGWSVWKSSRMGKWRVDDEYDELQAEFISLKSAMDFVDERLRS